MTSRPLLDLSDLAIAADARVDAPRLVELDALTVARGERVALVGPSGVGKSTLLRGLVRLQPLTASRYAVEGVDALTWPVRQLRQRVAYVPQVPVALSESVLEDLRLTFSFRGPVPGDWRDRATSMLLRVGLDEQHWTTDPARLSVGQRMRLSLARTLLHDPVVLLLDEPFAPLDPASREALLALLHDWSATGERALIAVLHDPHLADAFATTRWVLSDRSTLAVERLTEVVA